MSKKILLIIVAAAGIIAVVAISWLVLSQKKPAALPPSLPPLPSPYVTLQDVQDIAFAEAKKWHDDAELVWLSTLSGETNVEGKSTTHVFWFSSDSASNLVYEVVVKDRTASAMREFTSGRKGGETPEKGFITEEEAIAEMHKLPGYENEDAQSIELVYGHGTGTWYWGIYTSKGAVSIQAAK